MKTLYILIIFVPVAFGLLETAHAQYGLSPSEQASHTSALQQELDAYGTQKEKQAEEEKQAKDISDAIILAEVGIPIAAGVSIGVLLFTRKRK